jgi:hypothetical protein
MAHTPSGPCLLPHSSKLIDSMLQQVDAHDHCACIAAFCSFFAVGPEQAVVMMLLAWDFLSFHLQRLSLHSHYPASPQHVFSLVFGLHWQVQTLTLQTIAQGELPICNCNTHAMHVCNSSVR